MDIASMGRKSKNKRPIGTRRERDELAFVPRLRLHVVVHLHEVRGLPAHGRTVIDDLDLKFLGCLIDDGHSVTTCLLVFAIEFRRQTGQLRRGHGLRRMPNAAKKIAFTRKIFHGTLPTVKLTLFKSPMRNSLVQALTLEKSAAGTPPACRRSIPPGIRLATIKPSGSAMSTPATPSSAAARETISFGEA
jgi:hypothetical protein